MRTKSQVWWLNLPLLPILPPSVTAKQRVVIIPGDRPEEAIDGYERKDCEKREVLRREWKSHETGQQAVKRMTTEKSWVMTMDRTDKEHEE